MSTRDQNLLIAKINQIMTDIGSKTAGTTITTKTNKAAIAFEFHIAGHMKARATARYEDAKKAAIDAGVLFDYRKEPREPGDNGPVYDDGVTCVWVTVKNGGTAFKGEVMYKYLLDNKLLSKPKADAALEASKRVNPPAHQFVGSWAREDK